MADDITANQFDFLHDRFAIASGTAQAKDEMVKPEPVSMGLNLLDAIVWITNDIPGANKVF
jgi:hypothetical protein